MSENLILGVLAMLCLVAMFAIYCGRRVRIRAHKTDIELGSAPEDVRRHGINSGGGRKS